jgi:hypothetical protein
VQIGKAILTALPCFPPFRACAHGRIKLRRLGVCLVGFQGGRLRKGSSQARCSMIEGKSKALGAKPGMGHAPTLAKKGNGGQESAPQFLRTHFDGLRISAPTNAGSR